MEFDFSTVSDRTRWSATKWEKYRGRDVIPLWIADMDFPTAPAVRDAIAAQVAGGDLGYHAAPADLAPLLAAHYERQYAHRVEPEQVVWLPGLVLGINLAVRACCADDEAVATFTPVYPPFLHAGRLQGRRSVEIPLACVARDGRLDYAIDFDALDAACDAGVRLLLLCHPHNPVGAVFDAPTLERLAAFCAARSITVCSDEVHCDLLLEAGARHQAFAAIAERQGCRVITLHGPGKVYNLAGLGIAWALIADADLRRRYRAAMQRLVPDPACVGYTALRTVLEAGEPWRQALIAQLRANRDSVSACFAALGWPHTHPAATFLSWADARALAARVGNPQLWLEQHGAGLSDGADFGAPGFLRLNFALSPSLLAQALGRIAAATDALSPG